MLALDKMDIADIGRYLASQSVPVESGTLTVEALGGGVSNIVLMVAVPGQCMVLKQALPELRVEAYWPSRIDRALREAEALRIVADHLPGGAVPEVYFIDEENFIYGMSCAPASATLWKEDLLAGVVDVPVAAAVGRLLAQMHAIQEPAVRQRFIDDEVFWQLRVDPYYNTTAEKHPSLQPVFSHAIAQMKTRRLALVHGDYSPKNMFVLPEKISDRPEPNVRQASCGNDSSEMKMDSRLRGNDGEGAPVDSSTVSSAAQVLCDSGKDQVKPQIGFGKAAGAGCKPALPDESTGLDSEKRNPPQPVCLLDFEVVHWGDPAFDLAFCINHLLIKSVVNAHVQKEYFRAVSAFMAGYRDELPGAKWDELQAETRLQLGCLMLARIDGKSPVEYITDEPTKETVRRVSRFILHEQPTTMDDIYTCIAGETVQ